MMAENSDEEIERDFLKDRMGCFRSVYDRYSGPLFRFLYRFTGNNQASEEILQDIFLELYGGSFKAVENGSLKSWLFTVAKNRGLNYRKKSSRMVSADLSGIEDSANLEERAIAQNLLHRLVKAEEILPVEIRETWNLRKTGLDNQEIANQLSIPLGTVKSRFSRLVDYLRKEFEHGS